VPLEPPGVNDVDLRNGTPARPRQVAQQFPAIIQLVGGTKSPGVRKLDVGTNVANLARSQCGHSACAQSASVGTQRYVAGCLVLDGGPKGNANFCRRGYIQQHARIPAPGVATDVHQGCGFRQIYGAGKEYGGTCDPLVLGIQLLPIEAEAKRNCFAGPIGDGRIDVERLDVEHERLSAADPGGVIAGFQAEGGADAQPQVDILGDRATDIGVGDETKAATVTAIARQGTCVGSAATELEAGLDCRNAYGSVRPHELGHACRVVEHGAGVLG